MRDRTKATLAHEDNPLTPRELELLALVAGGLSTAQIAKRLDISPSTLKTHLTNIFRKTGTANRVQASRYYLERLHQEPAAQTEVELGTEVARDKDDATSGQRSPRTPGPRERLSQRELQVLELGRRRPHQ